MRGLLVAIMGALGLGAWWQRRRRHDGGAADDRAGDVGSEHAEALRTKLAETRLVEVEEPADEQRAGPDPSPLDPESRRRDLHERTRASIDELGS